HRRISCSRSARNWRESKWSEGRCSLFASRSSLLLFVFRSRQTIQSKYTAPRGANGVTKKLLNAKPAPGRTAKGEERKAMPAAFQLQSSRCFHCLLAGWPLRDWLAGRVTTPCLPPRSFTAGRSLALGPALV